MSAEAVLLSLAKKVDEAYLAKFRHQRNFGQWFHRPTSTFYTFRMINGRLHRVDDLGGIQHIRWNRGAGLLSSSSVTGGFFHNEYQPIDCVAKAEAIRAGWMLTEDLNTGKTWWILDTRPMPTNSTKRPYGGQQFEEAARFRGEWPLTMVEDENQLMGLIRTLQTRFNGKEYGAEAFVQAKLAELRVGQNLRLA